MKPGKRILIVLLMVLAGVLLILGIAFFGEKSRGPLEDMLTGAGEMIRGAEDRYVMQRKTFARNESLYWLSRERDDLLNPPLILTGVFDEKAEYSLQPVFDLEDLLETRFPLIHIYTAWGSKPEQQFPRIKVESILRSGSIPVITWEPWLTDFDDRRFPVPLRSRDVRDIDGLTDIANGVYDSYIRSWALEASAVDAPVFLRFAHEMNDPYRYPWGPHHNEPAAFVKAWKHVRFIFESAGAGNVIWIWSPHTAYGMFDEYYPGPAYVDWVGVGALNYGVVAPWSQWWTFDEIFGNHYDSLMLFNKPVMISEFGSLAVGGNRVEWYTEALNAIPEQFPGVKSLLFFHYSADRTTTQQALDWSFKHDEDLSRAIADALNRREYRSTKPE